MKIVEQVSDLFPPDKSAICPTQPISRRVKHSLQDDSDNENLLALTPSLTRLPSPLGRGVGGEGLFSEEYDSLT